MGAINMEENYDVLLVADRDRSRAKTCENRAGTGFSEVKLGLPTKT